MIINIETLIRENINMAQGRSVGNAIGRLGGFLVTGDICA